VFILDKVFQNYRGVGLLLLFVQPLNIHGLRTPEKNSFRRVLNYLLIR
jgi:hypothetical protein